MAKNLVIVESPAKAKTIEKFLGSEYKVMSSFGHIRDLHKKDFSIDVEHGFKPLYEIPDDKEDQVKKLKAEAAKADVVTQINGHLNRLLLDGLTVCVHDQLTFFSLITASDIGTTLIVEGSNVYSEACGQRNLQSRTYEKARLIIRLENILAERHLGDVETTLHAELDSLCLCGHRHSNCQHN